MRTQIAVGVIYNASRDKVLVARRPDGVIQGGLWEFPGGKLLPDEEISQALKRELFEELNLEVDSACPLITIDHDYPGLPVTLNVWSIMDWHGQILGNEGQDIEWISIDNLNEKNFPEANQPIITAVRLPHLYLITPNLSRYDKVFFKNLNDILQSGVSLMQFRSRQIPVPEAKGIIRNILEICNDNSCMLLINGSPAEVVELPCHGVHLSSDSLLKLNSRPLSTGKWVAASCHNERELDHACNIGVDFAVLSPVNKTRSHPNEEVIGWEMFRRLVRNATIPVYALGGMGPGDMRIARKNGAQGIAMISSIWGAKDKVDTVKQILNEERCL